MTNQTRYAVKYFATLESELVSRFSQSESPTNSMIRGRLREKFIKDILRRHLPSRFGITTNAQILDRYDRISQEQDIVVFRDDFPVISVGTEPDVLFAESVIATIQVKSSLSYKEYTKDLDKINSVRRLYRKFSSTWKYDEYKDRIKCYLVAYKGPKLKTLGDWASKYLDGNDDLIKSRIYDVAWILGRGIHKLDDGSIWEEDGGDFIHYQEPGAVGHLIAHLVLAAGRHPGIFPNIGDYLGPLQENNPGSDPKIKGTPA